MLSGRRAMLSPSGPGGIMRATVAHLAASCYGRCSPVAQLLDRKGQNMPKKAQDGGGNYLGAQGLVALADANAVVLAQRVEQLADFKSDKPEHKQYAPSKQIKTHILVVSSKGGERDGEFWPDQNLISAGWTLKLIDEVDGAVIAGRAATYGARRACLNAPSDP